jgi:hypothetical protein
MANKGGRWKNSRMVCEADIRHYHPELSEGEVKRASKCAADIFEGGTDSMTWHNAEEAAVSIVRRQRNE